jgi:hypothetical protein
MSRARFPWCNKDAGCFCAGLAMQAGATEAEVIAGKLDNVDGHVLIVNGPGFQVMILETGPTMDGDSLADALELGSIRQRQSALFAREQLGLLPLMLAASEMVVDNLADTEPQKRPTSAPGAQPDLMAMMGMRDGMPPVIDNDTGDIDDSAEINSRRAADLFAGWPLEHICEHV